MNSKQKGNRWELEVCHIFEEVFNDKFMRTPSSGGLFGKNNRSRADGMKDSTKEDLSADIITPKDFPYSIECKNYNDLAFHQILQGYCAQLNEWIEQASSDAKFIGKKMLIVMKLKRKGAFVCLNKEDVNESLYKNKFYYLDKYIILDMKNWLENINI